VLAAVEAGEVDLTGSGGEGSGYRADGRVWVGPRAALGAGAGATIKAGTGALWRAAAGPTVLLVVVVALPDGGLPGSPPAGTAVGVGPCPWRPCV
jgi:hypothetical protein